VVAAVTFALASAVTVVWARTGTAQTNGTNGNAGYAAQAVLTDAKGDIVAIVQLKDEGTGRTRVSVRTAGLTEGFHGFHLHAVGTCDPNTVDPKTGKKAPFLSAGPHFSPKATTHAHHAGDMPPLLVLKGGGANMVFETDRFTVGDLFDADGSAVIIHAEADNLGHIPDRYKAGAATPTPTSKTPTPTSKTPTPTSKANNPAKDEPTAAPSKDSADAQPDAAPTTQQSPAEIAKAKGGPDEMTLMTGDAGARFACGVIEQA
jgi:Cu-Zn family superoxide dismutase